MARAKRTDRAEARRKYRAYLQAQQEAATEEADGADGEAGSTGSTPARGRDPRTQPAVAPGIRMGMLAAARAAYRTPHYRDDIRNVRSIVFGSKAIWPGAAICVASGVYGAIRVSSSDYANDPILAFLFQFLFIPVPLLPPMLAGFLAPRSTWLAGLISSFIATMVFVVMVGVSSVKLNSAGEIAVASPTIVATATAQATSTASAVATPASNPSAVVNPGTGSSSDSKSNSNPDLLTWVIVLLPQSLSFGFFIGALSGWYKRFLANTSGPRNRPQSRSGGQRSPQRRRPAR